MNKTLKWILIGLAIAVGAFLVALPIFYMVLNHGAVRTGGLGIARHMPGMRFAFGGFFMLFRMLIPLGILVLAVFGVIHLVRGGHKPSLAPVQPVQPVPPVAPVAAHRVCVNCGKGLPLEGEYCPSCGAKQ